MLKKPFSKKGNNFWEAASLEVGCRVPPPPPLETISNPGLKKICYSPCKYSYLGRIG